MMTPDSETEWKARQEALRERMRDPRQAWDSAQRNLSWAEQQRPPEEAVARRVREQGQKWRGSGE